MRIVLFFIIISISQTLAIESYAQTKRLSLNIEDQTIRDVLHNIEEQSEFYFMFDATVVDVNQTVNFYCKEKTITKILDEIFRGTNITYKIEDRQIALNSISETESEQQINVSGKVTDENGIPMPGVTVAVKGLAIGTTTDVNGNFSLENAPPDATLVFSFVGMRTQEIAISGRTVINVSLVEEAIGLEEVVTIGYGVQKKTSLTSSVSTIEAEKIANIPTTNVTQGLGGRMAGLIVRQNSGEPGRDDNNFYIRGISSTGNTQPLLIVDGIPRGFQNLDPNTIESFTVLKDAAAVAPYGVAGANGVILVTTKRGKSGAPTVTFNSFVGFQNPTVLPELPSAYEFASLKNIASINTGGDPIYSDYDLQKFKDGSDPDGHPNHNVYDELFQHNAPLTNYNIELSGGADRIKYYASIGYQHQEGIWETTHQNRFNYSVGIDANVTKTTNISLALNGREQVNNAPAVSNSSLFESVHYAANPTRPLFFSANGEPGDAVSAAIKSGGTQQRNITQIFSQVSIEQELPFAPGLKAKGTFAFDPTYTRNKSFQTPIHVWSVDTTQTPYVYTEGISGQTKPSLDQSFNYSKQLTYQASLTYDKSFGKNTLGILALFEAKSNDVSYFGAGRRNYDLTIDELNMGSSDQADISNYGSSYSARQAGFVYRLTYNYAQKYLIEVTGRYDGSYYFAPEKRWGFFPAFSAGWRISEEEFMKNIDWIDNLKLRGSYGEVGALAGSAFQYLSLYNVYGPAAVLDGAGVQGITEGVEANKNITWEKAKKTDVGVDANLWNGLLNIEADYFYELRSNMLTDPTVVVPVEYGVDLSQVNAGKMENRGIDINIGTNYRNAANDLRISLNGTFTFAKNKLLEVFETSTTYDNPNRRRTGRPLDTKFGFEAIGYFQVDDFDSDGNLLSGIATQPWGKVYPGDVRYKDISGPEGIPDGIIDNNDRTVIGYADIPQIIYGFSANINYKRFTLDVLFQGVGRTDINGENGYWHPFYNGRGAYKSNLDYWTPENPNASHNRITPAPTSNNNQTSSYLTFNSRYLRLKSLNISYSIPQEISRRVGIQNARVYISGQNLLTFTPIINYDPEIIAWEARDYPQQRIISVGVNLTFF